MIVENYGATSISEKTCGEQFQRFRNGNLEVKSKERPRPVKKFENAYLELEAVKHNKNLKIY